MLVAIAVAVLPGPGIAGATPRFTIVGHGFGHGVGLAQWGAQGLALQGRTAPEILAHYYQGTTIGALPAPPIRVLLDISANPCFELAAGDAATISGAAPSPAARAMALDRVSRHLVAPVGRPITPGPTAAQSRAGRTSPTARILARRRDGAIAGDASTVTGAFCARADGASVVLTASAGGASAGGADGAVVTITPAQPFSYAASSYRGALVLRADPSGVQVVNALDLESYVRGVVSRESPSSWRPAALESQAIVARSYALAEEHAGASFDVYPDERSQVYGGVAAETAATDQAVASTAGQVVLTTGGTVATTFFSSSSGGRTSANEDAFGGPPIPYLRSVADPADRISPYSTWGPLTFTGRQLGAGLGIRRVSQVVVRTNPSRRVASVAFGAPSGATTTLSGAAIRSALGLRSTWFSITMLDLSLVVRHRGGLAIVGRTSASGSVLLLAEGRDGRLRTIRRVRPGRRGTIAFRRVRVPAGRQLELATGRSRSSIVLAP